MIPIESHPGHDRAYSGNDATCKCKYIHSAIQKSYRLMAEGKKITWRKLEQELDESQKANIKGKTLYSCYWSLYRRWRAKKVETCVPFDHCVPYNWPEVKAKEFYEWLNLTEDEQNKLLAQTRRVASSHLDTSAAPTTTSTPSSTTTENGLNYLVHAASESTSTPTPIEQELRSRTDESRFSEDFKSNFLPILKAILNIKTEINSGNDRRKIKQTIQRLLHFVNKSTTIRSNRIHYISLLLQIVNAHFSEDDQRFIHINDVRLILIKLNITFSKFPNLFANLSISPDLKDVFFKQLNRYANCCIASRGSSNLNWLARLELLLRDKYPETAFNLRRFIATRDTTVAPPRPNPFQRPAITPTRRPTPVSERRVITLSSEDQLAIIASRLPQRQNPTSRPTSTPTRRPAPNSQPTTTPSRTLPSTPAPARTTTPSSTTAMSNQDRTRLFSLTNYVQNLIRDEEASLDEKKNALENLKSLGERLINRYEDQEKDIHSKIDGLIGSLYWKISEQEKTPKLDLNKPYPHVQTRKRPAESTETKTQPRKRKAVPIIDLTGDDI